MELSCVRNIIPRSRKRLWNGYPALNQELQNHSWNRWAAHTRIGNVWEYPPGLPWVYMWCLSSLIVVIRDLQIEILSWFTKSSGTDQMGFERHGNVPQSAQDWMSYLPESSLVFLERECHEPLTAWHYCATRWRKHLQAQLNSYSSLSRTLGPNEALGLSGS